MYNAKHKVKVNRRSAAGSLGVA